MSEQRDKLIASQQLEIFEMKEPLANIKNDASAICMNIVGMRGPLNDNVKGYTKQQMADWQRVLDLAESILAGFPDDN
jgi:hypothetical protein